MAVARAKPDGYTLLLAYSGYQVGNPHLFKKAGWNPLKDFTPIAMLTRAPQVLATKADLPANNILVDYMNPTQLGEYTKKELDYWGRVIRSAKITAE